MPGKKHLGLGRLKEMAFQVRFWQFLFQSPLRQCFCILHKEKESKKSGSCSLLSKNHCHRTDLPKVWGLGQKNVFTMEECVLCQEESLQESLFVDYRLLHVQQNTREKNVQQIICSGTVQHINQLVPRNKTWISDTTAVKPVLICFCFNDLQKLVQTDYQQYIVFAFFLKKIF